MMSKRRDSVGIYILVALTMIGLFLWRSLEPQDDPRDTREVKELASLADREDLNILFILVDTLRADRIGAYGYPRPTTPNIDRLAATGIRFGHQVAQSSWTKTSMASLWTGLYPSRHGIHRHSHGLPEGARLPAETLAESGFETAAIWRNGWVSPNFGFNQGFRRYTRPKTTKQRGDSRRESPTSRLEGTDEDVLRSTFEFLRTHKDTRWLLYLHLMDVHQYVSDKDSAIFGTDYSDLYDNALLWTDKLIGILLDQLWAEDLRGNTLVVLASDHGEAFREHGREGHARDLYSEVTHVPFIIGLPFRLEEGVVVEERTANVDIWPTLLEIIGLESSDEIDGRSQVNAIYRAAGGEAAANDSRAIFSEIDQTWGRTDKEAEPLIAVTENDMRFFNVLGNSEENELYDLRVDPGEKNNLIEARPNEAQRLEQRSRLHKEQALSPWAGENLSVELDQMELNQLRALGYEIR